MRATLYVVTESGARRRLEVRGGHVARFGRSEWADFSFPDESALADVHFVVECLPSAVMLRDGGGGSVQLNGQPVQESVLRTGDRLQVGRTVWTLEIEGDATDATDGSSGGGEAQEVRPTKTAAEWVEMLAYLGVDDAALAIPQDGAALSAAEQYTAAAALRTFQLEPRGAVWWAWSATEPAKIAKLPAPQQVAWEVVRNWIASPDEATRRQCEANASKLNYQGPGGVLSAAVFFSGDNVAPPECPSPTPPDPRIVGRLVVSHFVVEAAQTHPTPPGEAWKRFLSRAAELTAAPIAWPEPRPGAAP
jgi:hypothetical protein